MRSPSRDTARVRRASACHFSSAVSRRGGEHADDIIGADHLCEIDRPIVIEETCAPEWRAPRQPHQSVAAKA